MIADWLLVLVFPVAMGLSGLAGAWLVIRTERDEEHEDTCPARRPSWMTCQCATPPEHVIAMRKEHER